jgi:hypothetical protein
MKRELDDIPDRLRFVIQRYIKDGPAAALTALEPISYHPYAVAARPALSLTIRLTVLRRDGWLCRYYGKRTNCQPVTALLGSIFPNDFPHHTNWKSGQTHPAILTRSAQVDHIVPGSRQGSWTDVENLATACAPCNAGKGDLLLDEVG